MSKMIWCIQLIRYELFYKVRLLTEVDIGVCSFKNQAGIVQHCLSALSWARKHLFISYAVHNNFSFFPKEQKQSLYKLIVLV